MKRAERVRSKLIRTAALLFGVVILLWPSGAPAQQAAAPKRILVLYWYGRDWPNNESIERSFQTLLESLPAGSIEYYPEYLEADRFPGDEHEAMLRDYLRRKYAHRPIDVLVGISDVPLRFLLKYRDSLFPRAPIVFTAVKSPTARELAAGSGLTGIIYTFSYQQTVELALRLHPDTKQVFIVSGTLDHNKTYEEMAREKLRGYESRVSINYLTDLPPRELIGKMESLPDRSVVLYIWQQANNEEGKLLESRDVLRLITDSARVPIYGMVSWQVGTGIVGGYLRVNTETAAKAAEMALRIANGERAVDIPVETMGVIPIFDWRQLERWGISEAGLPSGSVVQFRVPTLWDQYKWSAIAALSVLILQSMLIAGLVINRSRRRRAEVEREHFALQADADRRRLYEVLSHVPGIVWESLFHPDDRARDAVFVNQYTEKMLGYSPKEWMATPNFSESIAHEDDRETIARGVANVAATGETGSMQFRWFAKDGRQLWVEAHLAPMHDADGKVIGLRGITLDITDRVLVDESLHTLEERNRAILRAIPDLIFLYTADGVYLDYQANSPRDLLVPPAEFLGKNIRDVLPARLAEDFMAAFRRARESDEPQCVEYMLSLRNEERWFEARIVVTQVDKFLNVVRDITDRKRAEEAVKENEAKLGGIVGSAMDGIISIDDRQNIVLFNAAAEKMFGCEEKKALGQPLERFLPERFRGAHNKHIRSFGESNVTKRVMSTNSIYGRRSDGEEFPIEASISQLDLHGQKFYTIILRDITERRRAEKALREIQESLTIALDASQMGTWDLDLLKDFSGHRSLRHDQIFGYDKLQSNWGREIARRHIVEQDQEVFDTAFRNALATGSLDFEARVRWPNGSIHWMAVRGRFYFDENSQPLRGAGVNYDITERKRAEAVVRESEERFRMLFDAMDEGYCVIDVIFDEDDNPIDLRFIEINPAFEKQTGIKEAKGKSISEIGLNLEQYWFDIYGRIALTGETIRFENEAAALNRFYDVCAFRFGEPEHRRVGVVFNDITERKRAEAVLRESEERFRNMADTAPVLIWVSDTNNLCTYVNKRWVDFTGRTLEDELGNTWTLGIHPDDLDRCTETYNSALASHAPFTIEYRLRRVDGEYRTVYDVGVPRLSPNREFLGYIGSCMDVTDIKRVEEALRESEERFRNMADTAPVMIWVSGADKLFTYFNQQWLNFTGRTMEEEIGNFWVEGVHPNDLPAGLLIYNNAFDRHDRFTMEYRLRRADGKYRWILDTGTPRFAPGGEFLGYIGSAIDITERKAAEEALANLSGQLIRAREDECARIARELHDNVNQGMALVSIGLEQLGQKPDTPVALREQLAVLLSQIAETSKEIHRMSRDLHPSKLVHLGLVPSLKILFEELRKSHGLKIEFTNGKLPPELSPDVSLCLYRIVQECLNNVIKHSGASECEIDLFQRRSEIRLRVADSGTGFDMESVSAGKGLGLVSMRERLRLVGGSISIDSRPSLGTQIDARVPLRRGVEFDAPRKEKGRSTGS